MTGANNPFRILADELDRGEQTEAAAMIMEFFGRSGFNADPEQILQAARRTILRMRVREEMIDEVRRALVDCGMFTAREGAGV